MKELIVAAVATITASTLNAETILDSQSPWIYSEELDAFSDQNTSYLRLESDLVSRAGADAPYMLVVRCDGNGRYFVYMLFDGYMGGRDNYIPVRYRFDGEASVSERWNKSTDGTAGFLPTLKDALRDLGEKENSFNAALARVDTSKPETIAEVERTGKQLIAQKKLTEKAKMTARKGEKDFMTGVRSGKSFLFEGEDYNGSTSHAKFKNSDHKKFEFVTGGCQE